MIAGQQTAIPAGMTRILGASASDLGDERTRRGRRHDTEHDGENVAAAPESVQRCCGFVAGDLASNQAAVEVLGELVLRQSAFVDRASTRPVLVHLVKAAESTGQLKELVVQALTRSDRPRRRRVIAK